MPASSYADFAALRGDPSDGLPGVPGVGEKTAAFCGRKSDYKVRAAIAVSNVLTEADARKIASIESLLHEVAGA